MFGLARTRWTIDLSDDPASGLAAHLTQEDRVLLGELAAALGPRPTTGAMAGLIDALVALGLGTLQADGRLAFEVDPVERLLLDARSVLPRLFAEERAALATAVAAATGGSSVAAVATVPLGTTASVALDLVGPLGVSVSVTGTTLAGGASLGGTATVTSAGRVAVSAAVGIGEGSGPNGRFGVAVTVDTAAAAPVAASLTRTGGADGMPRSVALLPVPDVEALGRLGAAALPAEVARMALELAVRELPALAPLCDAVGLRDPVAARVRVPAGLMADPAGWLLSTATLGAAGGRPDPARVAAVVGALRALVPGPHPADGLALPWGLVLRTADVSGTLRVTVGLPTPLQLGNLRVSGSAGLDLQPSGAVAPAFTAVLDLTDPGAPATVLGGIDVGLGATVSAAARVPIGATILTVPVLPVSGGLGGLAGAATRALPIALDALTEVGTFGGLDVGAAVAALGDALDLRVAGHVRPRPAGAAADGRAVASASSILPTAPISPPRCGCCSTRSCPAPSAAPAPSSSSTSAPTSASTSTSPPPCRPSASRPRRFDRSTSCPSAVSCASAPAASARCASASRSPTPICCGSAGWPCCRV